VGRFDLPTFKVSGIIEDNKKDVRLTIDPFLETMMSSLSEQLYFAFCTMDVANACSSDLIDCCVSIQHSSYKFKSLLAADEWTYQLVYEQSVTRLLELPIGLILIDQCYIRVHFTTEKAC